MTLPDHLHQLEAAGLIRLFSAAPELEYIFRHALTRDAAYTSLLRSQRQAVHRAAGEALEALCHTPALRASAAPLLAQHLAEAGAADRALDFWELAADQALAQYALAEATEHLRQALALAPQVPGLAHDRWGSLYLKRGRAQYSNTEWFAAWDTWAALLALGEQLTDDRLRLAALLEQASQRAITNPLFDQPQASALGEQALLLARRLGDPAAEAKALWILMRAHSFVPGSTALAFGEQSLALARAHDLEEQTAYTLNDLQYVYRAAADDERARAALAEAQVIWRRRQQRHMLADNLNQFAIVAQSLGDLPAGERAAQEALALSGPTQNVSQGLLARELLAAMYMDEGRYAAAAALLADIDLAHLGFFGAPVYIVVAHRWAYLGQWSQALAAMHAAEANASSGGFTQLFRYGQIGYTAYLHAELGQFDEAEELIRLGQGLPQAQTRLGFANFGYYLPLAAAKLAVARGQWAEAQAALAALCATLEASGPRLSLAEAQLLLGRAQAGAGLAEAGVTFAVAAATADRLGQRRMSWRAWQALAQWQAAHEQPDEATAANARARAHLDVILANLGDPAAEVDFRNLPDVQAVLHWNQ